MLQKRSVGIIGYGHLGEFLAASVIESEDLELKFVWNRDKLKIPPSLASYVLKDLDVIDRNCDLIVEVAHPRITLDYGPTLLKAATYMIGSPTALADTELEAALLEVSHSTGNGIYIPSGALWGGEDIRKMSSCDDLKGLTVTMKKHPSSFKLEPPLSDKLNSSTDKAIVLYEGSVRNLCPLAPNNVNTMAAAAIAARNLGFDNTIGRLVSDPSLTDAHVAEVDVEGPNGFRVKTTRYNPARVGDVTGQQTYHAILASIRRAHGKGPGIHLC